MLLDGVDDHQMRDAVHRHAPGRILERLARSDRHAGLIAVPPAVWSSRDRTVAAATRSRSETIPHRECLSAGSSITTTQWTRLSLIKAATALSDASGGQLTRPRGASRRRPSFRGASRSSLEPPWSSWSKDRRLPQQAHRRSSERILRINTPFAATLVPRVEGRARAAFPLAPVSSERLRWRRDFREVDVSADSARPIARPRRRRDRAELGALPRRPPPEARRDGGAAHRRPVRGARRHRSDGHRSRTLPDDGHRRGDSRGDRRSAHEAGGSSAS